LNIPKRIDLTPKQMDELLKRVRKSLRKDDYEIIKGMADTISFLSSAVDSKSASIQRLLKMLFGSTTEKTSKVYDTASPALIVRISAKAPLSAKVYELQKLRCNLCGQVFTAKAPEALGDEKYDSASGAMIALLKYGSGLPFNRLAQLQASLGIPLPSSTQWEIVASVADKIHPVYRELIRKAAQGDIIHNDDTVMKILDRMNLPDEDKTERNGMFTSGFMSIADNIRIALFVTGHNHAGENMDDILAKRSAILGTPIQMCDGLSRNTPKDFKVILANCLTHARRRFVD